MPPEVISATLVGVITVMAIVYVLRVLMPLVSENPAQKVRFDGVLFWAGFMLIVVLIGYAATLAS